MKADCPDYYRHTRSTLISRLSGMVRNEIFKLFMEHMQPTELSRVLDVGVTPDTERSESNFFERRYPYPYRITSTGIEDAGILESLYPGLQFVLTSGTTLPFEDNTFDFAFSNAVVEHVGDREAQRKFIAEICRVSRKCLISVPDRLFPVEHHTALPLLHYLPQAVHRRLLTLMGRAQYNSEQTLNLISKNVLQNLLPSGVNVRIVRIRLFGLPSNLVAIIDKGRVVQCEAP